MWPVIAANLLRYGIPIGTGLATGYDIYQKTGDIGKASVGGLASGGASYGLGLAGQRLAGMAGNRLWPSATPGLVSGSTALGMRAVSSGIPALVEAAGGAFGLPAMAGGVAAGLTPGFLGPNKDRMAGDILQKGLTAAGVTKEALYQAPSGELNLPGVPDLSRYGGDSYQDVAKLTSTPRAAALASKIAAEQELQNSKLILPYMAGLTQQVKDADLLRQLAARQQSVRQDTGARSMLQAQLGAQQLAQQGNQAVLQAAAQRGGYV